MEMKRSKASPDVGTRPGEAIPAIDEIRYELTFSFAAASYGSTYPAQEIAYTVIYLH